MMSRVFFDRADLSRVRGSGAESPLRRAGSVAVRAVMAASLIGSAIGSAAAPVSAANPRSSNPSHSDPHLVLAIHGDETSVALHDECQQLAALLAKQVPPLADREAKGQSDKNPPEKLAQCHVAAVQLGRLARRLQALGEPSGYELAARSADYRNQITYLTGKFVLTPPGVQHLAGVRQRLPRTERERAATLKKVQELIQKKQVDEAERTLDGLFDKLSELTMFLTGPELKPIYDPFNEVQAFISATMEAQRMTFGRQLLAKRRDETRPDVAALVARIGKAAAELAKADRIDVEGTLLNGPETFAHFVGQWSRLHAAAVRCQGLHWALEGAGAGALTPGGAAAPAPTGASSEIANDPVLADYAARSAGQISQALAGLIAAETQRVAPADVPTLHQAWLEAAAPVVGRVRNDELAQALRPALTALAARAPEYGAQVAAYEECTDDLLRWKRRTAEVAVAPLIRQQPTLEQVFQRATASATGYNGLFPIDMPDVEQPALPGPAPLVLEPAVARLVDQVAVIQVGQGLAGGKSNVTRLRSRTFATLKPNVEALAAAVTALETDLLVAADRPPLSLRSAAALRSLALGDFVSGSGKITGCHLEGWLTRLAGLPDAAWPVVPLGQLPAAHNTARQTAPWLGQAAMRFEVEPTWLRHEYAIVLMPAPAAAP